MSRARPPVSRAGSPATRSGATPTRAGSPAGRGAPGPPRRGREVGTLYLVATPIGNLEDLTARAARVLAEADVIACEDTRRTRQLLDHLGVRTPTLSLHEHNERARIPELLDRLRRGEQVAVVADAGTPAISDPGTALVAAAAAQGLRITVVPGPSAVTAAVALADFPAERFAFVGFLPRRAGDRRRFLQAAVAWPLALVAFEAPHRVRETLEDLAVLVPDRRMIVVREATKVHEEVLRGRPAEVAAALAAEPRGEITLVIEGARPAPGDAAAGTGPAAEPAAALLERLLAAGLSRRDAARVLSAVLGLAPKEAYRLSLGGETPP